MVLLLIVAEAVAKDISNIYGKRGVSADSIMEKVIFFAPFYESIVNEYRAELYIKGRVNIRKKNHIIRFLPTMFRIRKGVNEYMMETYSDLHFTAPDIYDQKVKAGVGLLRNFGKLTAGCWSIFILISIRLRCFTINCFRLWLAMRKNTIPIILIR